MTNGDFNLVDLSSTKHQKLWDNVYVFNDISIGQHSFNSLEVVVQKEYTSFKLRSDDAKYFDYSDFYFGISGHCIETEPFDDGSKEFRKKLGTFTLSNRPHKISIKKSTAYGSIITIDYFK